MTCPFPPCRWYGPAIEQQARFGDPETNMVLPIHDVQGEAYWFGRCPGSQLVVPELTAAGEAVIRSAMAEYSKRRLAMLARRVEQEKAEQAARELLKRRPGESLIDYFARTEGPVALPNTEGIAELIRKHAARVDPRVDLEDYFPGRPADAPEPGVGDAPDMPVPPNADVTPLGRAGEMDNAKDNLNALIAACGASLDSYIEDLSRVLGLIERTQAMRVVANETVTNAQQLMIITLGSDPQGSPQPARDMIAMTRLSRTTLSGGGAQSVVLSLAAAHEAILAALNQANSARANATAYLAMPK